MLLFRVDEGWAGRRLDEFLAARLSGLSRMRIAGLVARGACAVGGAAAHAGWRLRAGDAVEVALPPESPNAMTPEPLPLKIVYEDEHLVVVDKPSGMLVHPTRGVKRGTLANALTYHLNRTALESRLSGAAPAPDTELITHRSSLIPPLVRPGIVHRLDRATSGLLVVAKTQDALSQLARHFHRRLVEKRYLALVCGRVRDNEMVIRAPIGKDPAAHPKWRVTAGGKEAETRLRVLGGRGGLTLVELEPVTGRTNQLRIHCAHAGHPVAGDEWYGSDGRQRLCLHAARLAFRHPFDNRPAEFTSPLPPEVLAVWEGEA
jgi:23S rRNA pseudouridine1911/1915/1917 synthase